MHWQGEVGSPRLLFGVGVEGSPEEGCGGGAREGVGAEWTIASLAGEGTASLSRRRCTEPSAADGPGPSGRSRE